MGPNQSSCLDASLGVTLSGFSFHVSSMGFRQAAVLSSVSFVLGTLFICFTIDHKILFQPLTPAATANGYQFYTTFYNAPLAVKALLHSMIGLGVVGLMAKLHSWDESAIFFDGSSLVLYVFGIIIYSSVTITGLRTIVVPVPQDTEEDRVEALKVLSAGNTLIILCLVGVLLLQGGQEYARRVQVKLEAEAKAKAQESQADQEVVSTEKKTQ